ncbi:MAG TPA: asparagine synthase (glutamine-hydrolyzing) [Bacteroidia bacterium]|jgi:asparagine synthase (glutamine-hydrolysing)|nr:asparagine synthase (glutamine-hydrolyzing) [Bacteroidia bacterium]
MCGVAGILSKEKTNVQSLKKMTDAIAHRGPDGEGQWLNPSANIALGHRRLSIIDLSDNASQPMHSADGRYTMVFNGEIYNYIELKEQLLRSGHKFKTESDTEVLLKLYEIEKENCLQKLDGMFAFAIWDENEKTLFSARDRFGEKPFYYYYEPGKQFMFASEMKAIFALGVKKEINNEMLYNFIQSSFYITSPTDRSQTFYNTIKKLPPAHFLILNESLELSIKKYWSLDNIQIDTNISFEEAKEKYTELFYRSVQRRLRSDVPVGSSLSGGLDSSSIVCVINDLNKERKIKQNTFSARFANFHRDEGDFIQKVIDKTNVQPFFTWPDEEGFLDNFDKLLYHQEEPFPSASIYAQYCVMQKAKEENVTVLLDGQGADEILGGYEYYLDFYLSSIYLEQPSEYKKQLHEFRNLHKHMQFIDLTEAPPVLKPVIKEKTLTDKVKDVIRPAYKLVNPGKYKRIMEKVPVPGFFDKEFTANFNKNIGYDFVYHGTDLNGYLRHSVTTNNLEDLLRFCDRNSMAHSREVRLPFLSHELVEFIFSLPPEFKIHNGWTKYLMREAMKDILPEEITWRVDKIGYEPPQKKWLATKKVVDSTNDAFELLKSKHILDKNAIMEDHHKWPVLMCAYLFK